MRSSGRRCACSRTPVCATAIARRIRIRSGSPGSPGRPARRTRSSHRGEGRDRIDYVLVGWPHGNDFLDDRRRAGRAGRRHRGLTLAFGSSRGRVDVQGGSDRCTAADRRDAAAGGGGRRFLVRTYDPIGEDWTALIVRRGERPAAALTGVREMPHSYQRTIPLSTPWAAAGRLRRAARRRRQRGAQAQCLHHRSARRAARSWRRSRRPCGQVRRSRCAGVTRPAICATGLDSMRRARPTRRVISGSYTPRRSFAGEAVVVPDDEHRPLPPGDYELRLLHDETYVVLASARLSVVP